MRLLESAPQRYDAGMRLVTLGRVTALHDAVAEATTTKPGAEVLEIGCGTGAVTERLVTGGARVTALDQNPEMLEQARLRLDTGLRSASPRCAEADSRVGLLADATVTWLERTASEIDALPKQGFDAVVSSFAFSEMSASERAFVLRASVERLRPGGRIVLADEVRPTVGWQRALYTILRAPQAGIGWLVAGSVSQPIADLKSEIEAAGFVVRSERRWLLGSLAVFVAELQA